MKQILQNLKTGRTELITMKIRLTEEIWKEGNMLVSYCPELDIASCGQTVEQAKKDQECE